MCEVTPPWGMPRGLAGSGGCRATDRPRITATTRGNPICSAKEVSTIHNSLRGKYFTFQTVEDGRERSDAMELLAELLGESEEVLAHEVYAVGAERGLSKTTIWRAAKNRRVIIEGKGRAATWRLPIVSESFPARTYTNETI